MTPSFRYACLSPGGRDIWLFTEGDKVSAEAIKAMGRLSHGERGVRPKFERVTLKVCGQERRMGRWSMAMNGTTRAACLRLAKDMGFVFASTLEAAPDPKLDTLRRNQRFAYVAEAVRSDVRSDKALYVVMDLDSEFKPFSQSIRNVIDPRDRCCRPEDDRNWYVLATPENLRRVRFLVDRFGFGVSEGLARMLGRRSEAEGRPAPKF